MSPRSTSPVQIIRSPRVQAGLTLLEVIVAVSIMAVIAVVSYQSLDVVTESSSASQERLERLKRIDRTWIVIENDLRNILTVARTPSFGEPIRPFTVDANAQDYWLTLLRGGVANPLGLPRTEIKRVAYRLEDKILSRFSWEDTYDLEEENALTQKLLDGIEEIAIRVLLPTARNISSGPWDDSWPASGQGGLSADVTQLPLALEVTMTLDEVDNLRRFIPLVQVPTSIQAGTAGPVGGAEGGDEETEEGDN